MLEPTHWATNKKWNELPKYWGQYGDPDYDPAIEKLLAASLVKKSIFRINAG